MPEWIGAADAARRLGIKPASLYSYVSRGVLAKRTAPDGRTSQFDAAEVDQLARKGRPRRPAGKSGLIIGSALTEIRDGELRYRGLDAVRLAAQRSFEDVAELLWTGTMPAAPGPPWRATAQAVAVAAAAQAALPEATLPLERLQVIVPALAATDPLRLELGQPAVVTAARSIIAGMTDCLPAVSACLEVPGRSGSGHPAPGWQGGGGSAHGSTMGGDGNATRRDAGPASRAETSRQALTVGAEFEGHEGACVHRLVVAERTAGPEPG